MPIIYWHQEDEPLEQVTPLTVEDESDHWWSGVQKNFASVALASVLAITAASTAIAASVARDTDEIPAGSLSTIPEDDSWRKPLATPAGMYVRLPLGDNDEIYPTTPPAFAPDEDIGPPARRHVQWAAPVRPFSENDEYPHVQADEDFWRSYVQPVTASMRQRLPLADPEELPANTLRGQPDEDYWNSSVAPRPLAFLWPQQFTFDQSEIGQPPTAIRVEDYWRNSVRPVAVTQYQKLPYAPDPEEIPAGRLSTIEETEWLRLSGATYQFRWPQQFAFEQHEQATHVFEDDAWQARAWSLSRIRRVPLAGLDDDFAAQRIADEDYWCRQTCSAAAIANVLPRFAEVDLVAVVSGGASLVIWIGEEVA